MASFTSDDVVNKLRELKLQYIQESIGADPSRLAHHLAEFLGYATLLYDHYATALRNYRQSEAKVTKEENTARDKHNKEVESRSDKMTVDEKNDRITIRLSDLKARREYLEIEAKGATLHINGIQTLLKTWGDEAKGVR